MPIELDGSTLGTGPAGLKIGVKGFLGDTGGKDVSQIYVEIYEGNLKVHVWDGSSQDPVSITILPVPERSDSATETDVATTSATHSWRLPEREARLGARSARRAIPPWPDRQSTSRRQEMEPIEKPQNWMIVNIKTGKYWSGQARGGWTEKENAERFPSSEMIYSLPQYGRWVQTDFDFGKLQAARDGKEPDCESSRIGLQYRMAHGDTKEVIPGSLHRVISDQIEESCLVDNEAGQAWYVPVTLIDKIADFPSYTELENDSRDGHAKMPVDRVNHREFVRDEMRYFCAWDSERDRSYQPKHPYDPAYQAVGWVVYKAGLEPCTV